MARPRTRNIGEPQKDLRIVVSADALERIRVQAKRLDQTAASFARQVIMERVSVLEAHGSQGGAVDLLKQVIDMGRDVEQAIMEKKTL